MSTQHACFGCASSRLRTPLGRSRTGAIALMAALWLVAPHAASALVVKTLQVAVDPAKSDKFQVTGAYGTLDFASAQVLAIRADRLTATLPLTSFTRKRNRLTYRAPKGSIGVTTATIDLKKHTFAVKGSGIVLSGLTSPLAVRLGTETAVECAMVTLSEHVGRPSRSDTRPKRRFAVATSLHAPGACTLADAPLVDPTTIITGVSTQVRVTIAPAVAADGDSLQLFERAADGALTGPALCTLRDDGVAATGDDAAGDGVYGCIATFDAPAPGTLTLVVRGGFGGTPAVSTGTHVPITPPAASGDVDALIAANGQAQALWEQNLAALGDTLEARVATLRALRQLPGVEDAAIAADGLDIGFLLTSGLTGGLMLSPRPSPAASPAVAIWAPSVGAPSGARARAAPAADACPTPKERHLVGALTALVWDPGFFAAPGASEAPAVAARLKDTCPLQPGDVATANGAQCTVASLVGLAQYGTVVVVTHGAIGYFGRPVFLTTNVLSADNEPFFDADLRAGRLEALRILGGPAADILAVSPTFILNLPGRFQDALIYAGFCWSDYQQTMASAFRAKGARTYFGYDFQPDTTFAAGAGAQLFDGLMGRLQTTGDSYADVNPKTDPTARAGARGVRIVPKSASLMLEGDDELAYVGTPMIAPTSARLDAGDSKPFTVDLPRGEDCDLRYDWHTTIHAGALTDDEGHEGAGFRSDRDTATYVSDPTALGLSTDTLGADVRVVDPADPGAEPALVDQTCAQVAIAGCGDGVKDASEQCDGDDDAACPGHCLPTCTCGPFCGDNHVDPGEICDGTDKAFCDAISPHGVGYCHPDCHGCAVCGDGVVDPGEQCDTQNDASCPNGCRNDCTCGCAVGDPNGCPATQCCDGSTHDCCTPRRVASDPACPYVASGCCGPDDALSSDFCGGDPSLGQTSPAMCPDTSCADDTEYVCMWCDNKLVQGECNSQTQTCDF